MAIISFDNTQNIYKSGKAKVRKAELENSTVTIWYEFENGKVIRENYRLSKANETDKLRAAVEALLGSTPTHFDTNTLIGLPCFVQLEDRPWTEGRTWKGVSEVLPLCDETRPESIKNEAMKNNEHKSSRIENLFEDDKE